MIRYKVSVFFPPKTHNNYPSTLRPFRESDGKDLSALALNCSQLSVGAECEESRVLFLAYPVEWIF